MRSCCSLIKRFRSASTIRTVSWNLYFCLILVMLIWIIILNQCFPRRRSNSGFSCKDTAKSTQIHLFLILWVRSLSLGFVKELLLINKINNDYLIVRMNWGIVVEAIDIESVIPLRLLLLLHTLMSGSAHTMLLNRGKHLRRLRGILMVIPSSEHTPIFQV
jgi:hypothetical protein